MEFIQFINEIKEWGKNDESIKAIILVGSHARGTNKPDSDIDLCILTSNKIGMLKQKNIFERFGIVEKNQIEYYGAVTSIRIWYQNGFEVEYGITDPNWIAKPLDEGTMKVLADGYRVIVDKENHFNDLKF